MLKLAIVLLLCMVATCMIIGGWTETDVNSELVVEVAQHASKELSKQANTPYHLKLHKVVNARFQVVAGFNFDMKVIIGETKCRKNEIDYDDVESCDFQDTESTFHKCDVRVLLNLKGDLELQSSDCVLASFK